MSAPVVAATLPVPSRCLLRFLRSAARANAGGRYGAVVTGKACNTGLSSRRKLSTAPACRSISLSASLPGDISSCRRRFTTSRAVAKSNESNQAKIPRSEKSWQEKLWGASANKGSKPLQPDDLPNHHDNCDHGSPMFTSRRTLAAKAALEPRLRCTEVDEYGKVILVDGEFKKTELIAKVSDIRSSYRRGLKAPVRPTQLFHGHSLMDE